MCVRPSIKVDQLIGICPRINHQDGCGQTARDLWWRAKAWLRAEDEAWFESVVTDTNSTQVPNGAVATEHANGEKSPVQCITWIPYVHEFVTRTDVAGD